MIRELMAKSLDDENLSALFQSLMPQQRLVNIIFDEVKLVSTMRYSAGHVVGLAENKSEELATYALVIELGCHHGGPRWVHQSLSRD